MGILDRTSQKEKERKEKEEKEKEDWIKYKY